MKNVVREPRELGVATPKRRCQLDWGRIQRS